MPHKIHYCVKFEVAKSNGPVDINNKKPGGFELTSNLRMYYAFDNHFIPSPLWPLMHSLFGDIFLLPDLGRYLSNYTYMCVYTKY